MHLGAGFLHGGCFRDETILRIGQIHGFRALPGWKFSATDKDKMPSTLTYEPASRFEAEFSRRAGHEIGAIRLRPEAFRVPRLLGRQDRLEPGDIAMIF